MDEAGGAGGALRVSGTGLLPLLRRASAKMSERSYPSFRHEGQRLMALGERLWTCARVAAVIRKGFGISYHPAHISRLVRALGLSLQKPRCVRRTSETRRQ